MPRQGETAGLGRTRIEHMEQHAFAGLYADRLTVAEHPAIDAEKLITHLETLGFLLRLLVGHPPDPLQGFDGSAGEHVHFHIPAAAEGRRELLHHQEDFAVVGAAVVFWFDVNRPDLAGVSAAIQVSPGRDMRMVKPESRGPWHERDTANPACRHERRAFFGGAVD